MNYRYLGRTGVQVSPICLGSDDFGDGTPPAIAENILLHALDACINLIDTEIFMPAEKARKLLAKH